jgi:hypothetical protein
VSIAQGESGSSFTSLSEKIGAQISTTANVIMQCLKSETRPNVVDRLLDVLNV